jgi:hypothetical protein
MSKRSVESPILYSTHFARPNNLVPTLRMGMPSSIPARRDVAGSGRASDGTLERPGGIPTQSVQSVGTRATRFLQFAICNCLLLIAAGCGKPVAPLDPLQELKAEVPVLGAHFEPNATGTICGRVVWTGELPHEHSFRDAKVGIGEVIEQIEKKNPGLPRVRLTENGVSNAVVFLRNVEPSRSKLWDLPAARVVMKDGSILIEQGRGKNANGFVHVGDEIEMTSVSKQFEMLRFQGASFFTMAFADPDKPTRRTLPRSGLIELSSGAGNFWARSWLFVAEHPYYTLTDYDGRFTLTGVPEGDYELVCWMPNWNVERFERDPEMLHVSRVFFMPPMEKSSTVKVKRDGVVYVEFLAGISDFAKTAR